VDQENIERVEVTIIIIFIFINALLDPNSNPPAIELSTKTALSFQCMPRIPHRSREDCIVQICATPRSGLTVQACWKSI